MTAHLSIMALVAVCSASSARAWTLSFDPPARLQGDRLNIQINYANCHGMFDPEIDESISAWNSVPTSALNVERSNTPTATTGAQIKAFGNVDFAVVCDTSYSADTGSDPSATLAVTMTKLDGNGNIGHGGIVVNFETSVFTSLTHEQKINVLTHEIGHLFGLGHSSDPAAIMYYSVRAGGSKIAIAQDDVDAASYLYPRNAVTGEGGNLFGCASITHVGRSGDAACHAGGVPPSSGAAAAIGFFGLIWIACQALRRSRSLRLN